MYILLVGAELEENLAVRYLWAALERAGHTVAAAAFAHEDDAAAVLAETRRLAPEMVGLSITFQRRAHEFGHLARALRHDGYQGHITCGGHFATFAHRALLEHYPAIDSVVRHEGEETLVELCAALEAGGDERLAEVRGLVFRGGTGDLIVTPARPLCPDLDSLPFPARPGEAPRHLDIPTATEEYAESLAEQVTIATRALENEVESATRAIIAAARAPQRRVSSRWRKVALGALALPLAACTPRQPAAMPPDPPPPPHDGRGEPRRVIPSEPVLPPLDPPPPPTRRVGLANDPLPPPHDGRGRRVRKGSADSASAGHGKQEHPPKPNLPKDALPPPSDPVPMPPDPPPPPHRAR